MDTAHDLADRLASLLRCEQGALAEFLLALSDFDRRRLFEPLGYSSLFHFLHRHLGMSKGAAHYRKTAAELLQRVPEVIEPLRAGTLCMTSIIELAKVLTPENKEEVLPRFLHCSRPEGPLRSAQRSRCEPGLRGWMDGTLPARSLSRLAAACGMTPRGFEPVASHRVAACVPLPHRACTPLKIPAPPCVSQ